MLQKILCALVLLSVFNAQAQKKEEGFDFFFKPTENAARYYVITEKKDTLWHRKAYYLPERGIAMEGFYKDKDCKIPHGVVNWYHTNRVLKSTGVYVNGAREGVHLSYDGDGHMRDSANYVGGRLKGVKLAWAADGAQVDSMHFDGAGNGVQVTWYADGPVSAAGFWTADTVKRGKWKYFHRNGEPKAIEEFADGKRTSLVCFDSTGKQLKDCEETEAQYPSGITGWSSYISRTLNPNVPVKNGAPPGHYQVVVQFIVNKEGEISDVKAETSFGFGMEEEAIRVIKASRKWKPALQFGAKVNAYRRQPITFAVSQR